MIYTVIIFINLLGFIIMGYDKMKARRGEWRIPEAKLFMIALLGGAAGVFMGMQVFRHKTKHYSFLLGIPLIFGFNLVTVYFASKLFNVHLIEILS